MRNKHSKVPWYSGELQAPPESTAPATSEAAPAVPAVSVGVWQDIEAPEDTLPHEETAADSSSSSGSPTSTPDEETKDPSKDQPPAPSTEEIEKQLEFLPSDTRDYEYCTHSTGHPAAPAIISRYKRFDTPDECQEAAQALVSSKLPDVPKPEPGEAPSQRKRRKIDPSMQIEATRSVLWKPSPKEDPDDEAPPSTAQADVAPSLTTIDGAPSSGCLQKVLSVTFPELFQYMFLFQISVGNLVTSLFQSDHRMLFPLNHVLQIVLWFLLYLSVCPVASTNKVITSFKRNFHLSFCDTLSKNSNRVSISKDNNNKKSIAIDNFKYQQVKIRQLCVSQYKN